MSDDMKLSLVTAGCVLALAVVAKWFLLRRLDFISQFAPIWIYTAYLAMPKKEGQRTRPGSVLGWSALIIGVTAAVALVYAL
jgi:hypothetical protein